MTRLYFLPRTELDTENQKSNCHRDFLKSSTSDTWVLSMIDRKGLRKKRGWAKEREIRALPGNPINVGKSKCMTMFSVWFGFQIQDSRIRTEMFGKKKEKHVKEGITPIASNWVVHMHSEEKNRKLFSSSIFIFCYWNFAFNLLVYSFSLVFTCHIFQFFIFYCF